MGFSVKVEGLQDVIRKLNRLPVNLQNQLKGELKLAAEEVKRLAVKDAPGDVGKLRQSIVVNQETGLSNTVSVGTGYGAFMEWGTSGTQKSNVRVPAEIAAYAQRFQGQTTSSGGSGLNEAIKAWVKRKGIGAKKTKTGRISKSVDSDKAQASAAFLIARKIRREGVKPHPFFFKNVFYVRDQLFKKVQELLKRLNS